MPHTIQRSYAFAGAFRLPLVLLLVLAGMLFIGRDASAFPAFRETVKTTYLFKVGGTLDKAGCTVCHAKPTGGEQMNPYGTSVKAAMEAKKVQEVTPELLHSLDQLDADGDGATNGDEFKSDTLPGDPGSHPPGATPKTEVPASPAPTAVSPFDMKAAVLAKHAQHPVLVHFPIALFMISFLFDVMGLWGKKNAFYLAAYYNLGAAAIGAVVAVITGLIAWQWQFKGIALGSDPNLQLHLIFGTVSCVLILLLWFMRYSSRKKDLETPYRPANGYVILALIAVAILALTGHLGGFVSGIAG